jgi:hypothetical protein
LLSSAADTEARISARRRRVEVAAEGASWFLRV